MGVGSLKLELVTARQHSGNLPGNPEPQGNAQGCLTGGSLVVMVSLPQEGPASGHLSSHTAPASLPFLSAASPTSFLCWGFVFFVVSFHLFLHMLMSDRLEYFIPSAAEF